MADCGMCAAQAVWRVIKSSDRGIPTGLLACNVHLAHTCWELQPPRERAQLLVNQHHETVEEWVGDV